jgi:CRP-like cAMP-binding protein
VRDRLWYALRRAGVPIPSAQRRVTLVEQNSATAERDHHKRVAEIEHALERIPLFKPLSHELVHELAAHTERRLYAPGEIVIQQGDYGEELFVIERGNVQVMIDRHGGMERVAALGPREFFGEMGLLTGEQRRASVRTESEVELLVVSKEALQPILAEFPLLADAISDVLAERTAQLHASTRAEGNGKPGRDERSGELLTRIRAFFSL